MDDLTTYREAACEAARRGAAVLAEWREKFAVREKGRADLVTEADVPGIHPDGFQQHAQKAKQNCPVSKLLAAAEVTLDAKLVGR